MKIKVRGFLMEKFTQDLKDYLKPIWKSEKIINETLTLVGEKDEGVLLYEPTQLLSVKHYFLDVTYQENVDYQLIGKKIIRLSDKVPYWKEEEFYPLQFCEIRIGANREICDKFNEKRFLAFGEKDTFTKTQLAVSYVHKGVWDGPIPCDYSGKFPNFQRKVKAGQPCKVLFYGDSITTGCNASGVDQGGNTPPYMPPFPNMICAYLQEKYGAEMSLVNTAVGGMATQWGLENVDERVISYQPDVVFIGFGMNDAGTPRALYKQMMKEMIDKIHTALPNTEIMLFSSILPNPQADDGWFGSQRFFHMDLAELEKEYDFVGFANVTTMHAHMLAMGKRYPDMTGNNINHPNDFTQRLYAQVLLTALLGKDFDL